MKLSDFFPEEYRLDIFSDLLGFMNSENNGLWIKKPHGMNCGKGIDMIGDVVAYREAIRDQKRTKHGKKFIKYMFKKKKREAKKASKEKNGTKENVSTLTSCSVT